MQEDILRIVQEHVVLAVSDAIENMAFLEVRPLTDQSDYATEVEWLELEWLYSTILLDEPFEAQVQLIMTQSSVKQITAQVYSIPVEEVSEDMAKDMMNETLNIITGRLVAQLFPDQSLKIGIPFQDKKPESDELQYSFDFEMGGLPFWFVLRGVEPQRLLGMK